MRGMLEERTFGRKYIIIGIKHMNLSMIFKRVCRCNLMQERGEYNKNSTVLNVDGALQFIN